MAKWRAERKKNFLILADAARNSFRVEFYFRTLALAAVTVFNLPLILGILSRTRYEAVTKWKKGEKGDGTPRRRRRRAWRKFLIFIIFFKIGSGTRDGVEPHLFFFFFHFFIFLPQQRDPLLIREENPEKKEKNMKNMAEKWRVIGWSPGGPDKTDWFDYCWGYDAGRGKKQRDTEWSVVLLSGRRCYCTCTYRTHRGPIVYRYFVCLLEK